MRSILSKKLYLISGWGIKKDIFSFIEEDLKNKFFILKKDYFERITTEEWRREEDVILLGWSLGGMVAIEEAVGLDNNIKALILVSSSAKFIKDDSYTGGITYDKFEVFNRLMMRNSEEAIHYFCSLFFSKQEQRLSLQKKFFEYYLSRLRINDRNLLIEGLDKLSRLDLRGIIKNITCPTLILHGDKDMICPIKSAIYLEENIENARLIRFKNCGHMPFFTQKERFINTLVEFIYTLED